MPGEQPEFSLSEVADFIEKNQEETETDEPVIDEPAQEEAGDASASEDEPGAVADDDGGETSTEDLETADPDASEPEPEPEPEAKPVDVTDQKPVAPAPPAELQTAMAEASQAKANALAVVDHFLSNTEQPTPPDVALSESDPFEYMRQKATYDASMVEIQQALYAQQKLTQEQDQEQVVRQQAWHADQSKLLAEKIPEWFGENQTTVRNEVSSYAAENGFGHEQLKHANAHELSVLHKAMLYDRSVKADAVREKESQENVQKAKLKATQAISVQKPGAHRAGSASDDDKATLRARAAKSGSLKDVANFIAAN